MSGASCHLVIGGAAVPAVGHRGVPPKYPITVRGVGDGVEWNLPARTPERPSAESPRAGMPHSRHIAPTSQRLAPRT